MKSWQANRQSSNGWFYVLQSMTRDVGRGGGRAPAGVPERFALMFEVLTDDPLWAREYGQFVNDVSFAAPEELVSYADAFKAVRRLVELVTSQ